MLALLLLCASLMGNVNAYWSPKTGGEMGDYHLAFRVEHAVCNDDQSKCFNCVIDNALGVHRTHIFEYNKDPSRFLFTKFGGSSDFTMEFVQDDNSIPFRHCIHDNVATGGPSATGFMKLTICIDTHFDADALPANCSQPIALVSLDADLFLVDQILGHQILYCMPGKQE